ncbi:MAG: patatin-like phospholipase family protein [Acidobacteriota bacterium]|nr:patatin-like phospholipase family protein [Acidobacteriota bacterium]
MKCDVGHRESADEPRVSVDRTSQSERPRVALVLSAGGLRGAVHLGVLRRMVAAGIPLDVVVGVSAGAVVAAYYAAVGLAIDELIGDSHVFKGRHLVAHSLSVRSPRWLRRLVEPWTGIIPERLRQLQSSEFEVLHHGVSAIGVVCHDLTHNCARYLATGAHASVTLYEAVATSASVPSLFPAVPVHYEGQICQFTDGGISDPLPIRFARGAVLAATHLIVSDCRRRGMPPDPADSRLVWVRPRVHGTTTLRAPRASLFEAVRAGEAAVTDGVLRRIKAWVSLPSQVRGSGEETGQV